MAGRTHAMMRLQKTTRRSEAEGGVLLWLTAVVKVSVEICQGDCQGVACKFLSGATELLLCVGLKYYDLFVKRAHHDSWHVKNMMNLVMLHSCSLAMLVVPTLTWLLTDLEISDCIVPVARAPPPLPTDD
eukprot:748846-Hanusia_phi.AAC.2